MHRALGPLSCFTLLVACAAAPEQPRVLPQPAAPAPVASARTDAAPPRPPAAPIRPVVDTYHDVAVSDPYRWLENAADPAVQTWSAQQNAFTRATLDALPDRDAIRARVSELLSSASADYFDLKAQAGRLFALEKHPPKQQPFLVVMKSADDVAGERVVLDPNAVDPSGKTSIDFYVPSPDGKRVAVSLSAQGSEDGSVHVYDVDTGKETGDVIARVNGGTAGGSVAWSADGQHLFYTRYPHPGERPEADLSFYQTIWVHDLGTPTARDRYSLGKDFPRVAEIELEASPDNKLLLARVAHGDGGEYEHFLRPASGAWISLAKLADKIIGAHFGQDGNLYLLSRLAAPRGKLLRLSSGRPSLAHATVVVPESEAVIQHFLVTRSRLYVVDLVGGPSRIRVFDAQGKASGDVPILPTSAVRDLEALDGDDFVYRNESYVTPPAFYRYDAKTQQTRKTALFQTSPADFSDAVVTLDRCRSKDGTEVPLTLLSTKGRVDDGRNPTLLSGYGGYGISMSPRFRAINRLWLDQGGVLAIASLRGGGEFGEAWHLAGNLTKKQNVFDDFAACMARLVETKITTPKKLAITGRSNGGLLMGATLVQHPEAFRAVVSGVGIYDMLRVETTPNGVFNVTEFGSVKDPEQFRALYAYSPYHHVQAGTPYPASLLVTGANDPRVDPYNSRKMVARLQAATSSAEPILLRASATTGHGRSNPLTEEIAENVDSYSFLLHELGARFRAN
jgi:prolyl oligopeptidase